MTTSKVLTPEDLKRYQKPVVLAVEVKALGGTLHVRGMTSTEGDDWEAEQVERGTQAKDLDLREFTARFLLRVLCDAPGALLYPPTGKTANGRPTWSEDQVRAIADLPREAVNKLYHAARPLSGVTDKDLQELVGNSGGGPSAASGSA